MSMVQASTVKPRKVEWLWRKRIPKGMITIVAGKPDQGKGLCMAHIAADVSRRGGNVLYSAAEDDAAMMTRPRLESAGANLDRVFLLRFSLPQDLERVASIVRENDIRLCVLDPLAAHLSQGISRHTDSIRRITNPLEEVAAETGCAFIVVEHVLKRVSPNAPPIAAIGGSGSGITAAARMAYIFGTDPEDDERRVLCSVKSNIREMPAPFAFETDSEELAVVGNIPNLIPVGETAFDVMTLLTKSDGKPGRKPDKRAAAAEWLVQYLVAAGQPVKAGDVMEDGKQHGLASKTVRRAADDMGVVRNPPGGGRNCTWDLPDEVKQAMGVDR